MVVHIPHNQLHDFLPMFDEHKYFRSFLAAIPYQSLGMGFTDDLNAPTVVLFSLDWMRFLAGDYQSPRLRDVVSKIPEGTPFLVPNDNWVPRLQQCWNYLGKGRRTALSSAHLSLAHVRQFLGPVPSGFAVHKVDISIARQLDLDQWDHIPKYFGSVEQFVTQGLAYVIKDVHHDTVVCMASSYLPYTDTLELDIVTLTDYRQKGLATIACAHLITECLQHGIKPHWDAMNDMSVNLALKLGYTDPEPYKLYGWFTKKPE
ncbi:MAG: GNAT family N-acetyltransferase [Promethearchaeota archaeon]